MCNPNTSHALRTLLKEREIQSKDLIRLLGHGSKYLSDRMLERVPWSLSDVYILCDSLDIPWEEIPVYFPRLHPVQEPLSPKPAELFPRVEKALQQQLRELAAQLGASQVMVSFTLPAAERREGCGQ